MGVIQTNSKGSTLVPLEYVTVVPVHTGLTLTASGQSQLVVELRS